MIENEDQDDAERRMQLARLEIEHEDYDHAIAALAKDGCDAIRLQRFKKKKLALKDEILKLKSTILPNIIA